jgi:hypothetical protein
MVLFRWGHGGLHAFSQAVPHGAVLPTLRKDISQTVLLTSQKNGSDPFHDPQAASPRAGPSAGKDGSMSFASREKAIFSQCEVGEPAAAAAGLELNAHPHMLRHACGYGHDTRAIQGWLGHRSITSTPSTRRGRQTGSRTSGGSDWFARNRRHDAVLPPLTAMTWPVMNEALAEAANTTASAI